MSKVCEVTGKKVMFGNNVSFSINKTKRRFDVNVSKKKFYIPEEDRWVTIGQAQGHYYLVVAHTFRNPTEDAVTIRLISARPATKHEIRQYEQG